MNSGVIVHRHLKLSWRCLNVKTFPTAFPILCETLAELVNVESECF